ncbi:MAG: aminotransferase class I/II-fold pyridoxal phosphate-dependent enzyme, partial [Aquificae bacterium]|nr:aminotransferase class I/II-fold pyridoxal phosphate-dependent enzyme [Aquificota bacterium]
MGRVDGIKPFIVMDLLARARGREGVVHMEIGEPDLPPSPRVLEALKRAVDEGKYRYAPAAGLPELREKIAEHYERYYGVKVEPERVVVTTGSSGALLAVFAVLLEAGEKLLLQDPSYPCYANFARLFNAVPESLPVGEEEGFLLSPEKLKGREGKVLLLASPQNPTGRLYPPGRLKELAELCEQKGCYLVVDEVYHGLVYGGREQTALSVYDEAIVINGFSKFFCMPGFRVGWAVLPKRLVRKVELIIQNAFISAPTPGQYAALEAFDYEHLKRVRETYRRRRDYLTQELKKLFRVPVEPEGAFYVWADASRYADDAY